MTKPARRLMPVILAAAIAVLSGASMMAAAPLTVAVSAPACRADLAILTDASGKTHHFTVELADRPSTREKGLMGRKSLPSGTGMLFVYETPRPARFWMKNTLIPLDMLFFDARGILRHIHANAQPMDETLIPGEVPGDAHPDRLLILELSGGEAARLGIAPGATLSHPSVPQAGAASPCTR